MLTAAETIAAAIEKLEALPVSIVPWRDVSGFEVYIEGKVVASGGESAALLTDADTIVTLHRTIDPDLELLGAAANAGISEAVVTNPEQFKGAGAVLYRAAVALARAILGEVDQ